MPAWSGEGSAAAIVPERHIENNFIFYRTDDTGEFAGT